MTIAIVCQNVVRTAGHGRVNDQVVRCAAERGHRVIVLADRVSPDLPDHAHVTWIPLNVQSWPTQLVQDQVFAWRSASWLRQHRAELDVVMTTGFVTWAPADVCSVHFVHSSWMRSPQHSWHAQGGLQGAYQYLYSWLNAHFEQRVFREAETVVAVSESIRDELIGLDVPAARIELIYNGVDTDEFQPGPADRNELGLPDDVPLCLFAGDIRTPRKNLDTVLHALVDASGTHLGIAGNAEGSPYPALARALGVDERVHFLGFRRDLPALMRAADFFVFPSRYEPFGLVVLEALASGLPVITSQNVGAAEVVNADCGLVIDDPNDTAALTAAIQRLGTGSSDCLAAMQQAARNTAQSYTIDAMAASYVDVFERMISHNSEERTPQTG